MADSVRIDKYLWAIRVFKTRGDATDACKGNKVRVGGAPAKPSKEIKIGDVIDVRKGPVQYTYKVKSLLDRRVGAKVVLDYADNLTPESEIRKLHAPNETFFVRRDPGTGRPTKKDRRDMEEAYGAISAGSSFDDDIPDDIAERFGLTDDDL